MKIQTIKFTATETAIDVDPGLIYRLICGQFYTPKFMYEEGLSVPVIDEPYFSPSGVTVRCENNQVIISCGNAGYLDTVLMCIESDSFDGAVNVVTVDLSMAQNITINISGGEHYTLNGPFTKSYSKITGTDSGHTYEEAQLLNVVEAQFNGVTYEVNGRGSQTGNEYEIDRYVSAYVDK